ncbi:FtsX-like permease family protein [mine drainage metagenome]|uniref:FtsX-like permease family protein n=1 Tax=mine drainage metagenome TaxID=410659 RepID=A0A1J5RUD8_9ZZZZ
MRALDRKLWRDLFLMKGQVLTISLVVACGVAAFVASLATYDSLAWTQQNYYRSSRFADVFAGAKRAPRSLLERIAAIPGVAEAEGRVVEDVTLDVPGAAEPLVGRLIGLPESGMPRLNRLHLRLGRLPDPARPNEVAVSEGFAAAHGLKPGDRLSAVLNGRWQAFDVVGVALSPEYIFALRGGVPLPDDRRFGVLWLSQSGLAAAFSMEGAFNDVVLRLAPGAIEAQVIDRLDRLLEGYGGLGAYGRSEQLSNRFINDELNEQEVMAGTIPVIFLGVAVFLLNVVLTRIIGMQREQIGALKAVGYGNLAVGLHYLKLVLSIVMVGALLGVALGAGFGRLMTASYTLFFRFPALSFRLDPWLILAALSVSALSASAGAAAALWRVVSLSPAEALRPPSPPVFGRSRLERLGLMSGLSPRARMIARNIARRPWRAGATVFGIALALPVLVVALFWQDALDYMVDVQFAAAERNDAVVAFAQPLSLAAARELARLPGVLQVEAWRGVPVRLAAAHHRYRTAIIGLPEGGELRRLLEADLSEVPMPAEGMLLTDRLAERLGVGLGDKLQLDVLEGERVRREVVVVGLVNDMLGLSAYMDIAALNRLLGEGETISAAALKIDPLAAGAVYARLKLLPQVATVTIKRASIQTFKETTAKFILVFSGILTAFAVVIAVGVVYNNARIALSERSWELASLRVLGFSRGEVSLLLLGELALEILIAIPLGMALGYLFVRSLLKLYDTEMFRIPLVIEARTFAWAALAVLASALVSALIVRHRIDHLDLVGVLKTRE